MASIRDNLKAVRERIARAEEQSGRAPGSVRLLAVSKTFPAEDVAEALRCGQRDFGENRVQELETKVPHFSAEAGPVWHLIGHLQTDKAAKAAALADWIHSVDSVRVLEKLDRSAEKDIRILLELNLSGEEAKTGMAGGYDALQKLIESALSATHLKLDGLMTMAALGADEKTARSTFAALRELRDRAEREYSIRLPELSMGMSADFEYAIREGSTIVRIGTAIFGGRDYGVR